jgi:hypothetical protein
MGDTCMPRCCLKTNLKIEAHYAVQVAEFWVLPLESHAAAGTYDTVIAPMCNVNERLSENKVLIG